jgi:uncharacterized protein YraI
MRTSSGLRLGVAAYLFALSAVAASQNAVVTDSADVYAGPDDSYPVVAQLDVDTPIQVMGCLDDWSWCDVSFADNRGWLYAPDITFDYEGGYVPFYTYAPSFGIPVVEFSIGPYWDRYYHDRPWFARRDEWMHREPPHHRLPPGPPPSVGPPPRSARLDNPPHEVRPPHGVAPPHEPERSLRLGSAEPPPREGAPPHDHRATSPDHVEPQQPAEPPRATERAEPPRSAEHAEPPHPAEPARHEEQSNRQAEPPHRDERAVAPERPAGPRHDEKPRQEKPGDHPEERPQ